MKKINWKIRFKNKLWLSSFISLILGFAYSMLSLFDVAPSVTKSAAMQVVNEALTFLGLIGVIADPTTAGMFDSERALTYDEPWEDDPDNMEEDTVG